MINRTKVRSLFFAAVGLAAAACQQGSSPDEASGAKSLDNLAAGKTVRVNSCKGSEADASLASTWESRIRFGNELQGRLDAATQARYKAQVREYLTAVPVQFQKAFLAMGGQIMLTERADEICSKNFSDAASPNFLPAERRSTESCMIFARGTTEADKNRSILSVFHQVTVAEIGGADDNNSKRIAHGGVRVFGMSFAQIFSRVSENDNTVELESGIKLKFNEKEPVRVSALKNRVANAFLTDMLRSKKYDIAALAPLLGAESIAQIKAKALDASGNLKQGILGSDLLKDASFALSAGENVSAALRAVRQQRFEDFVTGEGIDSLQCSTESRQVLASEFPLTEAPIKELTATLRDHADKLSVIQGAPVALTSIDVDHARASNGLALQGMGGDGFYETCSGCGCQGGTCSMGGCQNCQGGTCSGSCGGGGTASPTFTPPTSTAAMPGLPDMSALSGLTSGSGGFMALITSLLGG